MNTTLHQLVRLFSDSR